MLVIVRNQGGAIANAVTVRTDAVPIQGVLAGPTDDAVGRIRPSAGLAERRARLTGGPVAETAVGACSARRGGSLCREALGAVIGVLSEAGLASYAVTTPVSALGATEATDYT